MARRPRVTAVVLAAASVLVALTSLAIRAMHADPTLVVEIAGRIAALGFTAAGVAVALARPRNIIGWLLILLGALDVCDRLASALAVHEPALVSGSTLVSLFVLVAGEATGFIFTCLILFTLVFPSGRLLSRSWLVVAGASVVGEVVWGAVGILRAGPIHADAALPSPLGVLEIPDPLYGTFANAFFVSRLVILVLAAVSLVLRFRRSSGTERQQLKWVAASLGFFVGYFLVTSILIGAALILGVDQAQVMGSPLLQVIEWVNWLIVATIPLSIAVAMLRYRLFEIDTLIRRSLVYAPLSLALVVTYAGLVVSVQALLRPLTAGSDLAVAASTLVTLALVQPLRARIRDEVDRRFYRQRYDAARTIDAFTARLRDEVDLGSVSDELLVTVERSVRPAHAGVWLRVP